jgi:[amino group carrier protein]-L-2-aminoadipate 6-kinase
MIVVKVGGGAGIDREAIADEIAALASTQPFVIVHGGGEAATMLGHALGVPPRFVTHPSGHVSRFTDRATRDVFIQAVAGGENKAWVERLQRRGVNAFGVSGLDGRLLRARHKESVRSVEAGRTILLRGDHTGAIESADATLLRALLAAGLLPVVAPLAASAEGVALNVDADRAAAAIATAVAADALLLLSNVPGLLADPGDPDSLIAHVDVRDPTCAEAAARGRMKKKVQGAIDAVGSGVGRVVIGDGRSRGALQQALAGRGTVFA